MQPQNRPVWCISNGLRKSGPQGQRPRCVPGVPRPARRRHGRGEMAEKGIEAIWTQIEPRCDENDRQLWVFLVEKIWAGRKNAAPDRRNHYIFKVYSTQLHWAPYLMARAMFGFGNVRWHPSCPNFKTHWTATYYENDDLPANWGERRDVEQRLSFEGPNTRMAADRSQACLSGTSRVPQKRSAASLAAGTNTRAKTIKPSPEAPTAESTNEVPEEWDMAMKRALEDMSARNTKIAAAMKKNDGPARILATCFFWRTTGIYKGVSRCCQRK